MNIAAVSAASAASPRARHPDLVSARELTRPAATSAKRRANELPLRIYSSIVLGALALAATWAGGTVFALFWLAAAIGVLWEWVHVSSRRPLWLAAGLVYAGIFLVAMLSLDRKSVV